MDWKKIDFFPLTAYETKLFVHCQDDGLQIDQDL